MHMPFFGWPLNQMRADIVEPDDVRDMQPDDWQDVQFGGAVISSRYEGGRLT